MQYATARDGVRIAFGTAGKGPWIVRVPGLPFTHSQLEWEQGSDFFDQLAANWSVVQFDPRGTGLSDRNVEDFSLDARMLDLEAVVDRLGLDTFALHGIAWSGPVAVTYTLRHPERVSHLILDDSLARSGDFMDMPQVRALDQLVGEWDSFLEHMVFTFFGLGREQARPQIEYMRACVTQDVARQIFAAVRQDDVTDLLPGLSLPTLVLQHGGASKQSVEAARDMAARILGARFVMLDGLAHDDMAKIVHAIGELMGMETEIAPRRTEAARGPASGVRTILFTDVVEHTGMMRRLGDEAGRAVLREHEELTRDVLKRHGGDEVKTMGDGFMASFTSVTAAVECAIALQRAIEERNVNLDPRNLGELLQVRIGLNAGEPIEEAGDFFGTAVIMAARIAGRATGGEILASDVVRGLCAGKGFLFADRGEDVLRGFEDPVRLYEVRWRE
ncbi:MAG: adenylate/guanylate cyclase domain-containing protein [Dehalococcoidia bacterium]|nr:adenylate/guanylate cyclase domain-containing protein [Dehalococcoidia bacterium]